MDKKYRLNPPLGSMVVPKEPMTEEELRDFIPKLVGDPDTYETWKEKAQKDPIENLIILLEQAGFIIQTL